MRQKVRRMLALTVCLFVFFAVTFTAYGGFSDVSGHWAAAEVQKWADKGILSGKPGGVFKPEDSITRAEFVSIIDRVFGFIENSNRKFSDVATRDWYADSISRSVAAGIIAGDGDTGNFRPNDSITRQEAAVVLSKAFNLKAKNTDAVNKFADANEIASWSKEAAAALIDGGYIAGRPGNMFAPKGKLTRGETCKLLDNIAGEFKNREDIYTGTIDRNIVVSAPSIILKDMVINGDLYLAEGIGEGEVTLDNVTVKGRTIVRGGGENSIIIKNSSLAGTLIVMKKDGKVRIVAKGSTEAANVTLNSGAKLQEEGLTGKGFENIEILEVPADGNIVLEGDFEKVTIAAPEAVVEIAEGKVANLDIDEKAKDAKVNVAEKAEVGTLTANADVEVAGKGKIETANINSENVKIEQKPSNVNVKKGITADIGGTKVEGGATPPIGGGGGGGFIPQPQVINISEPNIIFTDGSSTPFVNPEFTAMVGDYNPSDKISKISFKTNITSSKLIFKSINSLKTGSITLNKSLEFSSGNIEITVEDLVGANIANGREGITVYTLKELFGDRVEMECTLEGTGTNSSYGSKSATISIILISAGKEPIPVSHSTEWANVTIQKVYNLDIDYIITAQIKADKKNTSVIDIKISNFLAANFGVLPEKVKVGESGEWLMVDTQKAEIADAIAKLAGVDKKWAALTLGELVGNNIYFIKSGDNDTIYKIVFTE